jgi:hypothetical protein
VIRVNHERRRAAENDLQRVIEPLASYICAADEPKAALNLALAVLANELARVNKAAKAHVATFAGATSKIVTQTVDFAAPCSMRQ